jgi:hypothetical protein
VKNPDVASLIRATQRTIQFIRDLATSFAAETAMSFAALYPSYGPIMPVDPRDIENGMKPTLSGWHDIRFSIFAARIFPWRSNGRSHKIPEA